MDEEKTIANKDYCYQAVTILTEDGKGSQTRIVSAGITKYDARHNFTFPIPNITALCLDQSYTTWVESQRFLKGEFVEFLNTHTAKTHTAKTHTAKGIVRTKEDRIFFDLVQKRMIAIVFAFTALESFANESIPDNFIFSKPQEDKKTIEEYTKEQTEFLSLDTKLHDVLPLIFHVPSPMGGAIWEKYLNLKDLRNRIVHMKSKDRVSSPVQEENIWKRLLNQSSPNVAIEAKKIIGYYLNSLKEEAIPLWYKNFPWEK